jgi:hypothetical protein
MEYESPKLEGFAAELRTLNSEPVTRNHEP